jgi:acylphosphatase
MDCIKIIVSGRVQGVGFRYFLEQCALQCGVSGYARNLHDGEVEIVVSGEAAALENFITLAKEGPRSAKVEEFIIEHYESTVVYQDFTIR